MKKLRLATYFIFFLLGTMFFSLTASAYIDPSAMTYIVQIIVGIVIAGGAAFAFYFKKLKRKLKKKDTNEEDYDTQENIDYGDDADFDDSNINDDDFDDFDDNDQ